MLDTASLLAPARPRSRAAHLALEGGLLAALYAAYTTVRDRVHGASGAAVLRGQHILRLERRLHISPEHTLNHALAAHPLVATVADYYYAIAHFVVTVTVLALLYRRRPSRARLLAAAWYVTNLLGLVGFWLYALAPPRLLPDAGFVDTVVRFHTWGSWASPSVAASSNQYAAMPSLHTAWAAWAAVAAFALTRRAWLRAAALAYPAATIVVVLSTANHYVLDVAGGLTAVALSFGLVTGAHALLRRRTAGAPAPAS